jgi:hypothetical protein
MFKTGMVALPTAVKPITLVAIAVYAGECEVTRFGAA